MKFHLRVYDNFHYMDESEAYNYGEFQTYEEALIEAKKIIDNFFEHCWKSGVKPDDLIVQYCLFGEDPRIVPTPNGRYFSAREYARTSAVEVCRKLENK